MAPVIESLKVTCIPIELEWIESMGMGEYQNNIQTLRLLMLKGFIDPMKISDLVNQSFVFKVIR